MSIYYKTRKYNVPVELVEGDISFPFVKVELDWVEMGENFTRTQREDLLRDFLIHVSDNSAKEEYFEGDPWNYAACEFIVRAKFLCNSETPEPPSSAVEEYPLREEALDSIDLLCDGGMSITNVNTSLGEEYGKIIIQFKRKK